MQSLDGLVKTLDEMVDFKYTQSDPDDEHVYLITKKGIFPYDPFDDISKLDYTAFQQERNCLASLLIRNARWKITFMLNSYGKHLSVKTLKSDVLLLTDFFEKFRETCLSNYGLDAAHYYSVPWRGILL